MTVTQGLLIYTVSFFVWYSTTALCIIFFQFKPESIYYKLDEKYDEVFKKSKFYPYLFVVLLPLFAVYSSVVLLLSVLQTGLNSVE